MSAKRKRVSGAYGGSVVSADPREGERLPSPHILMLLFIRREAVLTSKIDGTQATHGELFLAAVTGVVMSGSRTRMYSTLTVANTEIGTVFEELIRKFAEISNETAGELFAPREVIRLMVKLTFVEDDEILARPGVVRTIYDPSAGSTGGMPSVAGEYLAEHYPQGRLTMYRTELNDESYAICEADMLIKGLDVPISRDR